MLFLACSDDATDTAVGACVGEKKGVKNLLCVCVCVHERERERERETLAMRRCENSTVCGVLEFCVCVCTRASVCVSV